MDAELGHVLTPLRRTFASWAPHMSADKGTAIAPLGTSSLIVVVVVLRDLLHRGAATISSLAAGTCCGQSLSLRVPHACEHGRAPPQAGLFLRLRSPPAPSPRSMRRLRMRMASCETGMVRTAHSSKAKRL